MCGIAAYIGNGNAFDFISKALVKMEYRGYDSFGMRIGNRGCFELGSPSENMPTFMEGSVGIGHTRWATHGKVSIKNCHPVSYMGAHVVHNGTVENEQRHRERQRGNYTTDTDTEIIACELYRSLDLSIDNLDDVGSFVAMVDAVSGLCVYRGSNPLYYQDGKIASDLRVFEGKVYVIPENTKIQIDIDFQVPDNWKAVEVGKEAYEDIDCYMKHEIDSQPEIIKNLKLTNEALPKGRIKFIACGSSYYAAMVAAWKINVERRGFDATAEYATEFVCTGNEDALVFISQSGETKDVIEALKQVTTDSKSYLVGGWRLSRTLGKHIPIFILQNKEQSTLSQSCPACKNIKVINMRAGLEVGVAATKTFSVTLCQLLTLGGSTVDLHGIHNELSLGIHDNKKLATTISGFKNILILGSNAFYPLALEGALKLKEVAYIHAEAMPADEIKHGPIALIDEGTLSIVLGHTSDKIENNVKQIESRGGTVIRLDGSWWTTLVELQLLSYEIAILRGLNPDKPRNLAKTVTV